MTATQLLFLFLKEECIIDEMRFFKYVILKDCGNKYFRKRPLFKPTFVEDYLARNNRALNNFITRLFILAPNIVKLKHVNPRWKMIRDDFNNRNLGKRHTVKIKDWFGNETGETRTVPIRFKYHLNGMYVNYYRRKWNQFLRDKIESDKKFNSPFKMGESYEFTYKG